MNSKNSILFIVLFSFLFQKLTEGYNGIYVRNTRQRGSLVKRPAVVNNEDSYVVAVTKSTPFVESNNSWKPLIGPIPKHYNKPFTYSSKYNYRNTVQPSHPQKNNYEAASLNFILNKTALVTDDLNYKNVIPVYKKIRYQTLPKKQQTSVNQQYEVHETVEDEPPQRFQTIPEKKFISPVSYTETAGPGPEKHIHHLHYHDSSNDAVKASSGRTSLKHYRGSSSPPPPRRQYY